jgi:hypothetical protein
MATTKQTDSSTFAEEAWTLCGRANAEGSDQDKRAAHVNWTAAMLAAETRYKVARLRDKLTEALQRLDEARTTKQASLALAWLSGGMMDDILQAKTELGLFSDMVDGRYDLGDERQVTKHLSDLR